MAKIRVINRGSYKIKLFENLIKGFWNFSYFFAFFPLKCFFLPLVISCYLVLTPQTMLKKRVLKALFMPKEVDCLNALINFFHKTRF